MSPPHVDLLTLNGGKPNLSPTGEGITSYKVSDLFQRGTTQVKPLDTALKIELPVGYTLFNNLVYQVESDAVFSGFSDIEFSVPSARTRETFEKLRILYRAIDYASPEGPKWIDITLIDPLPQQSLATGLSKPDFDGRVPNFPTRTLHGFTEDKPRVLVVALRDPAKVRDNFTADLSVTGTAPNRIMQGRTVEYDLKITNNGPDTANTISLHATPTLDFKSVAASEGKCLMAGSNVYCKFPRLEKDHSIDVKIVERCPWQESYGLATLDPSKSVIKVVSVYGAEKDPFVDNNDTQLITEIIPDPNKGPLAELIRPQPGELFTGPVATVPLRVKASDPDGFVSKVEFFEGKRAIGSGSLRADGEYELIYKDVPFGAHLINITVTDNLGRQLEDRMPEFFVNGLAKVEITNPKAGTKLSKDGDMVVTIHASHPSSSIKRVWLGFWDSDATPIGNDDYVAKLRTCNHRCQLQATAIDREGIETRSEFVEFTVMEPPEVQLYWFDGEYSRDFEDGATFKVSKLNLVAAASHRRSFEHADIAKIEFLVNGKSILTLSESDTDSMSCLWTNISPGLYKLQAVATDTDGAIGRSRVIEVKIERP
jgi:hypothetical protein